MLVRQEELLKLRTEKSAVTEHLCVYGESSYF